LTPIGRSVARARKRLEDLAVDGTFLARRHAQLLVDEPLLDEPTLRQLQEDYRVESSELEQRAIALRFEKAVRDPEQTSLRAMRDRLFAELDELLAAEPVEIDVDVQAARSRRAMLAVRCRDLREEGLTLAAVGQRVGTSAATVRRLLRSLPDLTTS
jgi:hypothetical protein